MEMDIRFRGDDDEALARALLKMVVRAVSFGAQVRFTDDGNDLEIRITGVPEQVLKELAKEAERLAKEFGITVTRTIRGSLEHHHHHH
uniref:OR461 n=1 Tax=synthetic construct TaxID=32630 RepID=UPI00051FF3F6|nr:Chain A, OR461 [synthetic construct]4RJV_B Chain B, OR461 [synthetic construct]4RJV_C Chain C, OR461 [synthetic construct]4RJV_D Chain D, OR461 [synthetic construct]